MANKCCMAKIIWDGVSGQEEYWYPEIRYSSPWPTEKIIFFQFKSSFSNNEIRSITVSEITYNSSGTIEYTTGRKGFED